MTKELPVVMGNYFPISNKREDTYVAGLSMGGYGAFMLAMRNPDKYVAAASMSGAMDACHRLRAEEADRPVQHKCADMDENMQHIFGSTAEYDGSQSDLFYLVKQLEQKGGPKPDLFFCCGLEDGLLEQNRRMEQVLKTETHLKYQYKETHGIHNWYYWNKSLVDILKFFGFSVNTDTFN